MTKTKYQRRKELAKARTMLVAQLDRVAAEYEVWHRRCPLEYPSPAQWKADMLALLRTRGVEYTIRVVHHDWLLLAREVTLPEDQT